ncbi:M57 family metalloprotease [Aquimarina agarilytica]|uniref:M57 family metalloprotease n=1 Tax=Aquimarina agarilytica TaxID=1087449 RepID=UPI00028A0202|nr:M57 family metalloprotease [Aquimarina agarilytica]
MKKLKIVAIATTAILMVQCQDENTADIQPTEETSIENQEANLDLPVVNFTPVSNEVSPEIVKGLQNMGYDTVLDKIENLGNHYLVGGDMIVDKESILEAAHTDPKGKQRRFNSIMRCSEARDVTVRNLIPSINTQVRNALNDWNRIRGSFLRLRLVNGGNADMTIMRVKGVAGAADRPRNGKPGRTVYFDPDFYKGIPRRGERMRFVIRHEIGHNLGFLHTNEIDNQEKGQHIPGTPNRDRNSIMNSAGNLPFNPAVWPFNNFTEADKRALRKMYGGNAQNNICF